MTLAVETTQFCTSVTTHLRQRLVNDLKAFHHLFDILKPSMMQDVDQAERHHWRLAEGTGRSAEFEKRVDRRHDAPDMRQYVGSLLDRAGNHMGALRRRHGRGAKAKSCDHLVLDPLPHLFRRAADLLAGQGNSNHDSSPYCHHPRG